MLAPCSTVTPFGPTAVRNTCAADSVAPLRSTTEGDADPNTATLGLVGKIVASPPRYSVLACRLLSWDASTDTLPAVGAAPTPPNSGSVAEVICTVPPNPPAAGDPFTDPASDSANPPAGAFAGKPNARAFASSGKIREAGGKLNNAAWLSEKADQDVSLYCA